MNFAEQVKKAEAQNETKITISEDEFMDAFSDAALEMFHDLMEAEADPVPILAVTAGGLNMAHRAWAKIIEKFGGKQ